MDKIMDIYNRIVDIIVALTGNDQARDILSEKDDLSVFGINSLYFIRFVVELENEFDIEFDDEDLDYTKYQSVQSICEYIQNRTKTVS